MYYDTGQEKKISLKLKKELLMWNVVACDGVNITNVVQHFVKGCKCLRFGSRKDYFTLHQLYLRKKYIQYQNCFEKVI